ncbi:MAG TPA: SDR family NAD(P)-dependent oxidoreductase, partial [Acidimicrobiia bacterium]|nr:SDR family NAD(P)-dependent oxidoreductase [Acidimicrobiia bacterium]
AGLLAYSWDAIPYITSKFGVYGFTEGLALYLRPQGVGVSVVCPGMVETNLGENARLSGVEPGVPWMAGMEDFRPIGAEEVAAQVVDAIRADRFLVLTHPEYREVLAERGRDLDAAVAARLAGLPDPPRLS